MHIATFYTILYTVLSVASITLHYHYQMDENNKLVPDKLNMLMDSNAKSKNKKMFKDVSKDVAAKCKMTTDKDK